ncbi:MAG: glycosyltransferase [Phycisphaerae bacterium]|jgi:sugar transferase (PEP-CTERM/EpsH1 system associated)
MPASRPPLVVHLVHSLTGGGTEQTLLALLNAFDPDRLCHSVVTLRAAGDLAARLPDHVACRPLDIPNRSRIAWYSLARILRDWRPAILHARNTGTFWDASIAATLTRSTRLVLGYHGLETPGPFNQRQRVVIRLAGPAGARFTTVSHAGARQLHQWAHVPQRRIHLVPNGVDLARFTRHDPADAARTRQNLGLSPDSFVIGTVGSLTPVKRQDLLIDAFAAATRELPRAHLLLVGDGPLRAKLDEHARKAGVPERVRFTGWRDDVPALLNGMDAFVCCSASEGMSNSVLEALAAGLPIIATDVGDNPVLVRDNRAGRIVPPNDPAALANALRDLGSSPELRRQYARAARTRAADFRFDRTVAAYENYYESLLAPRTVTRRAPEPKSGVTRPA